MSKLTHINVNGDAEMVDVSDRLEVLTNLNKPEDLDF